MFFDLGDVDTLSIHSGSTIDFDLWGDLKDEDLLVAYELVDSADTEPTTPALATPSLPALQSTATTSSSFDSIEQTQHKTRKTNHKTNLKFRKTYRTGPPKAGRGQRGEINKGLDILRSKTLQRWLSFSLSDKQSQKKRTILRECQNIAFRGCAAA